MHTNVIPTNKRCTQAQSNYTNTKLKAWFNRRLLRHPARKRSGPIPQSTPPDTPGALKHTERLAHKPLRSNLYGSPEIPGPGSG